MKNRLSIILIAVSLLVLSCMKEKPMSKIIDESLDFSVKQYALMTDVMKDMPDRLPRTIDAEGKLRTEDSRWWTSGFYPGCLWYLYESTNDQKIKVDAMDMTSRVEKEKYTTTSHDVGFMLYCSFGNGLRITGEESYNEVLLTGAKSLSTRFRPEIGCIQSWESTQKWQFPVIIDNMMNLELLMWAFRKSGDSSFYHIAVTHSDTTIKNHYRPDYSSFHVVSYDTLTGKVMVRQTHQGYSNESAWARGQVWGLYGFTTMYRDTKLKRYLNQAKGIAEFLINHPNMPENKIPYWDFNASDIPNAPRDASAGAIMASALIELSQYVDQESSLKYLQIAEKQLRTLASPEYLANEGENGNFILKHGVGHLPGDSEVDVPLTYADYYFIEALMRYRKVLSQDEATKSLKKDLADNSELPDPFLMDNGSIVSTLSDWNNRRNELKEKIQLYEYGHFAEPAPVEVVETLPDSIIKVEKNIVKKRVVLLKTGVNGSIPFSVNLFIPGAGEGPFPVIIGGDLCWGSLQNRLTPEGLSSLVSRGYIIAEFDRTKFCPDEDLRSQGISPFDQNFNSGAVVEWAWGYQRTVDFLSTLDIVDKSKISVTGHSRGGKAALLAGAFDERISLVAPNCSGAGGSGPTRFADTGAETLDDIVTRFPFWFCSNFRSFMGTDKNKLPFDQHSLIALVAPRAYLCTNGLDDKWANPLGTAQAHIAANEVFTALGADENCGIFYVKSGHDHNIDKWIALLDFADKVYYGKSTTYDYKSIPFTDLPKAYSWKAPAMN